MPTGRPPKPTALRVLEGNPGKRRLRREPTAAGKAAPGWLTGQALRKWREVAPDLEAMGVLGRLDSSALITFCQSWARWLEVEEALTEVPLDRQLHLISARLKADMKGLLVEFGMTPVARARLAVKPPQEDDTLGGILR